MNMQQMMAQAQKMQREMQKKQDELHKKEFSVVKGGVVTVRMTGDKVMQEVTIDEEVFTKEDKEMVEEMIMMAIDELIAKINAEEEAIQESVTGRTGGFGF